MWLDCYRDFGSRPAVVDGNRMVTDSNLVVCSVEVHRTGALFDGRRTWAISRCMGLPKGSWASTVLLLLLFEPTKNPLLVGQLPPT